MSIESSEKGPKVVISGYYGFDNCGDEAVLLAIVHCLKSLSPNVRVVVLSGNPTATREAYGVDAVNRWNPFSVALALLNSRLLISGGGSLLQDVTSSKSVLYYLAVIKLAVFLGKKVMIYCQGIGPLSGEKNRAGVAKTLNRCHVITVRDGSSAELLGELGVMRDIQVTCDPVMALSREDANDDSINAVLQELRIYGRTDINSSSIKRKPLLFASARCWKENQHFAPVAQILDSQAAKGWDVLLVPAQYPGDMEALDAVSELMTERPYQLNQRLTARQFLALAACADMVFSMRLHGLICAMAVGTPMLGVSYDPKVDAFMEQAGAEKYCLPYDSLDCELADTLLEELDAPPDQLLQERELRRSAMYKTAWETAQKAAELLGAAHKHPGS